MVMLQLLETHCLSILTYAIKVIYVANSDEQRKLCVDYSAEYLIIVHVSRLPIYNILFIAQYGKNWLIDAGMISV